MGSFCVERHSLNTQSLEHVTSMKVKMLGITTLQLLRKTANFSFRYVDEIQLYGRKILQGTPDFVLWISEN